MSEREWTDEELEKLANYFHTSPTDKLGFHSLRDASVEWAAAALRALVAERKELRHETAQAHGVAQSCSQRIAGVEAERDRLARELEELRQRASTFLADVRRIEKSDAMQSVYQSAYLHGVKYEGETWEASMAALKAVLFPAPEPKAPGGERTRKFCAVETSSRGGTGAPAVTGAERESVERADPAEPDSPKTPDGVDIPTCEHFSETVLPPLTRAEVEAKTRSAVQFDAQADVLLATDAALREACREAAERLDYMGRTIHDLAGHTGPHYCCPLNDSKPLVAKLRRLAR